MVDPSRGDVGVCGGQVEVFVEPILPAPMVVVIGTGHVGNAVLDAIGVNIDENPVTPERVWRAIRNR
jgi:xanthine/CO dehydrogenase XdhC/CoxF family maturation factor